MILLFITSLVTFAIYSYALVDPNLTLFSNDLWTNFRNQMVHFGYYDRLNSSILFVVLIIILFGCNYYLLNNHKKFSAIKFALLAGILSIISYPFLSHDFFNYLFDAKILTFYHQNPYLHKALDFPTDSWLRFMHWTIRTYPYGPTFLPITVVPSFLAFGKFFLNVLFFKVMFAGFYFLSVYYLNKIDKKMVLFFATQPLIIIEGLINSHNDIIAVSFGIIGIYYLLNKSLKKSSVALLISSGIKYMTAPLLILFILNVYKRINQSQAALVSFSLTLGLIIYLSITSEIQPWYFLNLFIFLPFFSSYLYKFSIFFTGLILSYYPFVRFGDWTKETIIMKHQIILVFFILNILYILALRTPGVKRIVKKT